MIGTTQTLHVSDVEDRICAKRDDRPTIYEIELENGLRLREPAESSFEGAFARAERSDLRRIRLRRDGETIRLLRAKGSDEWTVAR